MGDRQLADRFENGRFLPSDHNPDDPGVDPDLTNRGPFRIGSGGRPGRSPWITAADAKIEQCIVRRQDREDALVACLEYGNRSRMELLDTVWPDVPEILRPAAAIVLEAHLQKLDAEGRLPFDLAE